MNLTVFLPCRAGSERVPNKNFKNFAGIEGGLFKIKIEQLLKVQSVNQIIVSTNDKIIIDFLTKNYNNSKIKLDVRADELSSSSTSTDELINYVPKIITTEHILWTHVTCPFVDEKVYEKAINDYFSNTKNFDSLMTVNSIQTFLWNDSRPINYDRKVEKWPRTQTLPKIYEVNSGIFINSRENYTKYNDRIGQNPFMFETEKSQSFDIDWPEDFELAELIYKMKNSEV